MTNEQTAIIYLGQADFGGYFRPAEKMNAYTVFIGDHQDMRVQAGIPVEKVAVDVALRLKEKGVKKYKIINGERVWNVHKYITCKMLEENVERFTRTLEEKLKE